MSENRKLFALLIDGDNVSTAFMPQILHELNQYGELRISRVFHNKTTLEKWEQIAREYFIEPIWVPDNTEHKNAVDIALVMDAMTLLHDSPEITGFCIVATDSDYTRLARHLNSRGKFVLGIGAEQTPKPFRNACTKFVYADKPITAAMLEEPFMGVEEEISTPVEEISDDAVLKLVIEAYKQVVNDNNLNGDGRVPLLEIKKVMMELNSTYQQNTRVLAEKLKAIAEPGIIEIYGEPENKPVIHYVRVFEYSEIDKFRHAYHYAAEELKLKDKNGWVTLAAIGDALLKLYDTKYKQLKKVVEKMVESYPDFVELNTNSQHPQIRFKK
jgi:uncharacterized protein (TIGR00288 family)